MAPYTRQHHHHLAARKGSLLYSGILFRYPLIWTTCFVVLSVLFYMSNDFTQNTYYNLDVSYLKGSVAVLSSTLSTSFDATLNSQLLGEWRSQTEGACRNMMETNENKDTPVSRQQKEQLERNAMSKFKFPTTTSGNLPDGHKPYEYCRNVFIDLGTNIGDSIGYFIDNALDVCSPIWMQTHTRTQLNADFPRPHLDVTTLEVIHKGAKNNPLYGMLQKELTKTAPAVTPDTFCIYGMEGNPEFTERLQKLENHVMQMQPRPVQHLHIHTESVVTAVDGPTKLFLDKTSVEQNFWGSSILSSQQDAVKSAKELGNGEVFSADVQGISLSTLTKRSVLAYKPGAIAEETKGGLLIIKMDVEGAEYQVLKEAAASGVLCDYIQKGNRVVMIVEFHNMSITDPEERVREKSGANEAKKTLSSCGVEFGNLQGFWH